MTRGRGEKGRRRVKLRTLKDGHRNRKYPDTYFREDYPHLVPEDIRAAIAYGAASVAHEEVVLLSDAPPAQHGPHRYV